MMAEVAELGGGPGSSRPGPPAPCGPGGGPSAAAGCSVLVLVGALRSGEPLERLLLHIEAGEFRQSLSHSRTELLRPRCPGPEVKSSGRISWLEIRLNQSGPFGQSLKS